MRARVRVLRAGAKTSAFSTDFFASLFRRGFPSGFFDLIFRVNLSLRFPWSQTKHTPKHPIMLHRHNKSNTSHNKFFTFPRFFPSLEQFRPIYLLGDKQRSNRTNIGTRQTQEQRAANAAKSYSRQGKTKRE